jgi:hypothetical protein
MAREYDPAEAVRSGSSVPMAPPVHRWRTVAAGARLADRGRTRYCGPAEVHVSLRNPQVELVPCRRHQIVPTLVDTSKTMEGGTST